MVFIGIIGSICIVLLLFMYMQAHENNLRMHEVHTIGKQQEKVHIFFISDTHARKIDDTMITSINKRVSAVIIGGDFVDRRTTEETLLHNIRLIKQLGPTYFIWGNNDVEFGEHKLRQILAKHEISILENESIKLENENELTISAVSYRPGEGNIQRAIEHCEESQTVFIAHNPELFKKIHHKFQPILSIAGHLHGGQIRLGKLGFQPHGYFKKIRNRYELVSNGYGTTLLPLRFGAKPECHLIEINFKEKSS
ncbi:metallophosphoesterase [Solibacillus ferritrahens]|uniref:metallophosphoesterase n=1 Tax=Solibacillus ferritrahens TaxID=3098620 RepID=UPI00300B9826